ncbi:MAG: rRNA pseudouridine synthase [Deltaproteobacteria bacterium]|nr:rRNA pseudouridine synthase [Deltaproteobacteria bacterium]
MAADVHPASGGRQRLQRIIAAAGLASRRAAEQLILAGRVRLNGRVVQELGVRADPGRDRIEVDGRRLHPEPRAYVVLHKPRAVVSTMSDPQGRPTVAQLVRDASRRLLPVGRLDYAASGVLLMTNDGELMQALLRPRGAVVQIYAAKLRGLMTDQDVERWRARLAPDGGGAASAPDIQLVRYEGEKTWVQVTVRQGRPHAIWQLAEASGFPVMRLVRLAFAGVTAAGLRPGQWRPLGADEQRRLRQSYGAPARIWAQPELDAAARARPARPRVAPLRSR